MAKKNKVVALTPEELEKKFEEESEKIGASYKYLFVKTYRYYKRLLKTLEQLEESIDEDGPLIEKEYVKGRPVLTANPAISDYNKTVSAANATAASLLKIMAASYGGNGTSASGQPEDGSLADFLVNR